MTRHGAKAVAVSVFDRPALAAAFAGPNAITNLASCGVPEVCVPCELQ